MTFTTLVELWSSKMRQNSHINLISTTFNSQQCASLRCFFSFHSLWISNLKSSVLCLKTILISSISMKSLGVSLLPTIQPVWIGLNGICLFVVWYYKWCRIRSYLSHWKFIIHIKYSGIQKWTVNTEQCMSLFDSRFITFSLKRFIL